MNEELEQMLRYIRLGGLLAWIAARSGRASGSAPHAGYERGVLLASGLIAGEALAGVLIAIPRALEFELPTLITNTVVLQTLAALALGALCFWIARVAMPRPSDQDVD